LSSVKKKWKNRKFTEAIDRDENLHFIQEFGVDFDEHVQRVLRAMQEVADELGVGGSESGSE
jgi:predicted hydrolase (HD superfamily)